MRWHRGTRERHGVKLESFSRSKHSAVDKMLLILLPIKSENKDFFFNLLYSHGGALVEEVFGGSVDERLI